MPLRDTHGDSDSQGQSRDHINLGTSMAFLAISLAIVAWIFKPGYRLKAESVGASQI